MASHLQNPLALPPVNDLTCIVTGATSGIGREMARQLAEAGAHVVMAVRNPKAAHELINRWSESWHGLPLNIEVMELDLLSLDSVVTFANAWNARLGPLNVLINNAGIFSIGGKRKYSSLLGYTSSKLAQVMFSSVLHKRLPIEAGVNVVCVSPGIVHTNVARDLPRIVQAAYHLIPYFIFSAQEGSRSALFSATDPQIPEYCELLKADEWPVCAFISQDCRPTNPSEEAHNIETSFEVWEKTLEMIGLPSDAVERFIEGNEVTCRYGTRSD
ncbi:NAD(P)-binding Rossmann-fold superfamily protein isoform 2 [Theobroma cacao]|uniref:NAD(P)-binding Rossmann-fold superfamily protein isoform 2 n=1 Tax=Theobroma cacao TaxID=3641 RepID=A0A061FWI0_THECC|nr:NAD(P)-binding Rossmann-fold superfamily protein isoform 2 [Theobroma cacao]